MIRPLILLAALAAPGAAFPQAPPSAERPDLPRSMCDALGGAERHWCIAELRRQGRLDEERPEAGPEIERVPRPGAPPACDRLIGPEKELCLKNGGSVKTGGSLR